MCAVIKSTNDIGSNWASFMCLFLICIEFSRFVNHELKCMLFYGRTVASICFIKVLIANVPKWRMKKKTHTHNTRVYILSLEPNRWRHNSDFGQQVMHLNETARWFQKYIRWASQSSKPIRLHYHAQSSTRYHVENGLRSLFNGLKNWKCYMATLEFLSFSIFWLVVRLLFRLPRLP